MMDEYLTAACHVDHEEKCDPVICADKVRRQNRIQNGLLIILTLLLCPGMLSPFLQHSNTPTLQDTSVLNPEPPLVLTNARPAELWFVTDQV